jgi:hypothetical protein
MIDPLSFNRLYLVDALIYVIAFDSVAQAATITLEVDAAFHEGVMKLLPKSRENVLVDVAMSGVQSVQVKHIPQRNASWAADEKPHDWEIAEWQVRTVRLRSSRYVLNVRCQLGQEIRVAFEGVTVRASSRDMAVVHEYC